MQQRSTDKSNWKSAALCGISSQFKHMLKHGKLFGTISVPGTEPHTSVLLPGRKKRKKIPKHKPCTVINGRGLQPGIFIFRPTSVLYDTPTLTFEENNNKNISVWLIAVGSSWELRVLSFFVQSEQSNTPQECRAFKFTVFYCCK